jgi:hypothetical protein
MDTTIRRRTRATTFRAMGWLTVASMVGLALAGPSAGIASATKPDKVVLCHASGQAGTTKFETLTVAYNAAYGNENGNGGHFTASGTAQAGHELDYLGACKSTDEFGSLVVTKALAGDLTGFAGGDFAFSVTCDETSYGSVTINLATGSKSAPAITDIPADADCTVTETGKPAVGTYESWDSPAAGHATIVAGQSAAVTITNTRTYSPPNVPTCEQLGNCPVVVPPVTEVTPTASPTAEVLGATATPRITPPPTSTLPTSGTPGGDTWRVALLAIAGLVATLLLLAPATPAKARRRR